MKVARFINVCTILLVVGTVCSLSPKTGTANEPAQSGRSAYRSPLSVALAPNGKTLYVTDHTAGNVSVLDLPGKTKQAEVPLNGEPEQVVVSADGGKLYVAERGAGTVAVIDTKTNKVTGRIAVGLWPRTLALAEKTKRLYVANQDADDVSVIDLGQNPPKSIARIPMIREPHYLAVTPDEQFLVIGNQLPKGAAGDPDLASRLSIVDCQSLKAIAEIALPPGSTSVNGVCISPDGKWAYFVHQLGRFNLPITQLDRGWVNTYALSIVDIVGGKRLATLLLDNLTQGAANPWGVVCSKDGRRLWISHAGVHEISCVQIGLVHELLEGKVPPKLAELHDGARENIWVRISKDRSQIEELQNHLTALYIADAITRFPSGGQGPRELTLSQDESQLLIANYFSGSVAVLAVKDGRSQGTISLGKSPEADAARRGEAIFNDATHSFQYWHSCASCHPNGGRVDGLRWDFLRDGIGNPKDTINLANVAQTSPHNWRATRKDANVIAETSFLGSHLIVPSRQTVADIKAYLLSLHPEPSPRLNKDGSLTEAALRGKALFEGKANCSGCHPAPLFTDRLMHNVGILSPSEPDGRYDTPALTEVIRSAPYLHDGRAATLKDVLTAFNPKDQHGDTKKLSPEEINDLVEYLLSL